MKIELWLIYLKSRTFMAHLMEGKHKNGRILVKQIEILKKFKINVFMKAIKYTTRPQYAALSCCTYISFRLSYLTKVALNESSATIETIFFTSPVFLLCFCDAVFSVSRICSWDFDCLGWLMGSLSCDNCDVSINT